MGPAYRRVFIRSTRMYGRPALFFPRFTTRRRSWLASGTQINEFLRRVARAYPQIRARDQHVWPSWSRGKFAPRIVLYLSKNVVNAVRRIFYFFLRFFIFLFLFFPLRGQTLLFMEIFDTPGKIKNISRSSSERCNGIERKIIPSRVPETIIPRHVVGVIFSYVSLPQPLPSWCTKELALRSNFTARTSCRDNEIVKLPSTKYFYLRITAAPLVFIFSAIVCRCFFEWFVSLPPFCLRDRARSFTSTWSREREPLNDRDDAENDYFYVQKNKPRAL